jgi:hypothetical protein
MYIQKQAQCCVSSYIYGIFLYNITFKIKQIIYSLMLPPSPVKISGWTLAINCFSSSCKVFFFGFIQIFYQRSRLAAVPSWVRFIYWGYHFIYWGYHFIYWGYHFIYWGYHFIQYWYLLDKWIKKADHRLIKYFLFSSPVGLYLIHIYTKLTCTFTTQYVRIFSHIRVILIVGNTYAKWQWFLKIICSYETVKKYLRFRRHATS